MPRKRAVNGSGTQPRKRADGRWEVRYIRGTDKDGHPIRRSVYGSTALEAAEKLRAATASIDAGTYTDPCRMMLSQWLDIWLSDYCGSIKPGTLKGYRDNVKNHIKPALGTVSSMLAHSSVSFTLDVYGHVTKDMQQDAARKLQAMIDSL